MARGHWRYGVALSFALAFVLLYGAPERASACSCKENVTVPFWPREAATVALDTVLVVEVDDPERVYLQDDAGEARIPLEVVRALPKGDGQCGATMHFLAPTGGLAHGHAYTLSAEPADGAPSRALVRFRADRSAPEPAAAEAPSVRYHRVVPSPLCDSSMGRTCQAHDELEISGGSTGSPDALSFLIIDVVGHGAARLRLGGSADAPSAFYTALYQDPSEECVELEWVDGRGVTRMSERMCQPDKCAVPDGSVAAGESSCGPTPIAYGDELWSQVKTSSCKEPVEFSQEEGTGEIHVARASASGCALGGPSQRSAHSVGMFGFLFLGSLAAVRLGRARRRRNQR